MEISNYGIPRILWVTDGLPSQRANNAETSSMARHHYEVWFILNRTENVDCRHKKYASIHINFVTDSMNRGKCHDHHMPVNEITIYNTNDLTNKSMKNIYIYIRDLTHWILVMHICVSKTNLHWSVLSRPQCVKATQCYQRGENKITYNSIWWRRHDNKTDHV